jgi:hypothetical protein
MPDKPQSRSGRNQWVNKSPFTRSPVYLGDGHRLLATGDGKTHLIVRRSPLSQDSDPSWQQVLKMKAGMQLYFEDVVRAASYEVRRQIYTTPEYRLWLNDNPDVLRQTLEQLDAATRSP